MSSEKKYTAIIMLKSPQEWASEWSDECLDFGGGYVEYRKAVTADKPERILFPDQVRTEALHIGVYEGKVPPMQYAHTQMHGLFSPENTKPLGNAWTLT